MAYIGRDIEYGVLEKQSLTADGTSTDFTLNYGVGSSTALIVSVGGIVQELPDDPLTLKDVAEEIKYNPFISDYFYTSDSNNKVVGAEFVYAEYRPDGSYSLHAINPVLEPFKMGEYNPA